MLACFSTQRLRIRGQSPFMARLTLINLALGCGGRFFSMPRSHRSSKSALRNLLCFGLRLAHARPKLRG